MVLISTIGAALIGAIFMVITTMMNNASANRRHRMELRNQQRRSGTVGVLFVAIAILIAAGVFVATRPNDKTKIASGGPAPPSTIPANTSPTTVASVAAPACAAFTVQVAALGNGDPTIPEFEAQAAILTQALPRLGDLHRDAGDACGVPALIQFYFGPFEDADAARELCFGIGQIEHDDPETFTRFNNDAGVINYPYYRVGFKAPAQDSKGGTLLCDPELNQ